MIGSVFAQVDFIALVMFSILIPSAIYAYMMYTASMSRTKVFLFGITLVVLAGLDIFLLQRLKSISTASASLFDDMVFSSEISVALYLLPVLFAGIGVNLISHILVQHLIDAERRFDRKKRQL